MWHELGCPQALQPLVGAVSLWEDWTEHDAAPRDHYAKEIVVAARESLAVGE
jgi:hypothetical protein